MSSWKRIAHGRAHQTVGPQGVSYCEFWISTTISVGCVDAAKLEGHGGHTEIRGKSGGLLYLEQPQKELAIFVPQINFLNCPPLPPHHCLCPLGHLPSPNNRFSDSIVTSLGTKPGPHAFQKVYSGPTPSLSLLSFSLGH